jgi:hypothetical protein
VQSCARLFCDETRADPLLPPELRVRLDNLVDATKQVKS